MGTGPQYIAIDSEGGVWVSNSLSDNVTKVSPGGIDLGTFAVGDQPAGILFDGANIWVANSLDDTVIKLRPADGAVLGTFSVGPPGSEPVGLAFDGTDIWVANSGADNVTVLNVATGLIVDTLPTAPDGISPLRMAFDGTNMWVVNTTTNNVTKLRASDGFNLGTFAIGNAPLGIAFDGANIWVTNQADDTVTKRSTLTTLGPNLVSQTVNFQGLLKNAAGNPINGTVPVVDFRIYDLATLGPALCGETQSVTAEEGVFSVQLGSVSPFDADLFDGKELWLAVKVGADPEMLPRLQISSVAMALVAGSSATAAGLDCTGWVTATELAAGSVTEAQLNPNSVDSDKIEDGTIQATDLASGAVTNVKLANDSVDSGKIGDGTVGATDVSFNYAGSTGKGGKANDAETLDGLDSTAFALAGAGGSSPGGGASDAVVATLLQPYLITAVDTGGNVGEHISIAIGADGLPLIAYYDASNGDLKAVHSEDVACTQATISTLDGAGVLAKDVGQYTSIAIGGDGVPVISYYNATDGDLRFARCVDMACTSVAQSTVDSIGDVGQYSSIAIGDDGLPIMSYYNATNGDLKVAHCESPFTCFAATITTLDGVGPPEDVGQYSSIIGGLPPQIAYRDSTNFVLKSVRCGQIDCGPGGFGNEMQIAVTADAVNISVMRGEDGGSVYSYSVKDLIFGPVVGKCFFGPCRTNGGGITRLTTLHFNGAKSVSMTFGSDGNPIISYGEFSHDDLRMVHCLRSDCNDNDPNTTDHNHFTVDRTGHVGDYSAIAVGSDGLPVIAYYDATNKDLKVAHCSRADCSVP